MIGGDVPINLLRPFVVKVPGFILLFGGQIFETGQQNANVLMFNLSSMSWTILQAEMNDLQEVIMQDIKINYFKAPSKKHYSILYYNSEIWHLPSLKRVLKQILLSSSAKAIKICAKFDTGDISFINIHKMYKRASPDNFLLYKHALALYKLFWSSDLSMEFIALNFNSIITSRQVNFIALTDNKRKVGINALANRFRQLNNRIPLSQFNKSIESYKIFCKKEFLDCEQ